MNFAKCKCPIALANRETPTRGFPCGLFNWTLVDRNLCGAPPRFMLASDWGVALPNIDKLLAQFAVVVVFANKLNYCWSRGAAPNELQSPDCLAAFIINVSLFFRPVHKSFKHASLKINFADRNQKFISTLPNFLATNFSSQFECKYFWRHYWERWRPFNHASRSSAQKYADGSRPWIFHFPPVDSSTGFPSVWALPQ